MSQENIKQEKKQGFSPKGRMSAKGRSPRPEKEKDEFQQRMIDLARVTRVMAGGKRMKFRACMVIGDGKGRVGMGLAKGADVSDSITKAVRQAKKNLVHVPIIDGTLPHKISMKFKAARLMLKPAKKGSGIKAGGAVRIILDLAGVKDAVGKILGSNNKVNNVQATIDALTSFKVQQTFNKPVKAVAEHVNNQEKA